MSFLKAEQAPETPKRSEQVRKFVMVVDNAISISQVKTQSIAQSRKQVATATNDAMGIVTEIQFCKFHLFRGLLV